MSRYKDLLDNITAREDYVLSEVAQAVLLLCHIVLFCWKHTPRETIYDD